MTARQPIAARKAKPAARLVGLAAVLASALSSQASFAAPDEREQCASSAERAQQLRDDGKYRQARGEMLVCARSVCPAAIRLDCGRWLTELDRDAPTVVFGARDAAGKDLFDVKVSMDGELLQSRIDGKPVLVDVGEHRFTFETADGTKHEERVLVRTAEKSRSIVVTLGATPPSASSSTLPPAPTNSAPAATSGTAPVETMPPAKEPSLVPTLVVAGVGALAFTSFAIFGLSGKSDLDDLDKCKPSCDHGRVDSAKTKLRVADVSLAAGVVATGVAAYLFLTRKTSSPVQTAAHRFAFDGGAIAGGGYASVGGTF